MFTKNCSEDKQRLSENTVSKYSLNHIDMEQEMDIKVMKSNMGNLCHEET